jgi:hypothetical protein
MNRTNELIALSTYEINNNEKYNIIYFFNDSGEVLSTVGDTFTNGVFTNNNEFIGHTNKTVFVYNLLTNTKLNEYMFSNDKIILDAAYFNEAINLLLAMHPHYEMGQWYYENAEIAMIQNNVIQEAYTINVEKEFSKARLIKSQDSFKVMLDSEEYTIQK